MRETFYDLSAPEALKELASGENGLDAGEAAKRLGEHGENKLEGAKEASLLEMFFLQFKDFLVIILIIAALISVVLGLVNDEGILDGVIIFAIVIINAVLGVYQEYKAGAALKALKEMSAPKAKVIRNGATGKIPSNELVPGDIVILEAGDYVPADVRLISSTNLKIDESALTGESVPAEKFYDAVLAHDAGLGDRINSGYMGTIVTYGRGSAVVGSTGMKTEMGKIAKAISETEDETTPLQKLLDAFGKMLGIACIIVCVVIFIIGLFLLKMDTFEIFMSSVALAVAAIPEGLTIVVTVILAIGVQKMVKRNAIIKKLSAVETLGSTTVICSDKTGTLTQNKMTVVKIYDNETSYPVTGTGYSAEGGISGEINQNLRLLIEGAALCNDAVFLPAEKKIIGDPTEGALVVLAEKLGMGKDELNKNYPREAEFPFDSARKLMSTFHRKDGKFIMYTKGAPDELIAKSARVFKNSAPQEMTEADRAKILADNDDCAKNALRVLAVAYKELDEITNPSEQEHDLVFLGLLCMIDPPREEVKAAVATCRSAGIDVKMITGDHGVTARAIAIDLGISAPGGNVITGREITEMDDARLAEEVKSTNVFARVSPEHKVRLVSAIRENKNICAMTGDGVNDAPSLKKADIGVAMGITGTDVSKEAADMILTDDNFASIVSAVEEGRTIYSNIRKVIGYLISCNIGEILVIFFAMIINVFFRHLPKLPLMTVQLLSINLITDAFPAFALGMEEKESDVMNQKPRDPNADLVDKKMAAAIIFQSIGLAIGCLASFFIGFALTGDEETATTFCFVTIVLGELLRAYSARSENVSIFKMKFFGNAFLNRSVLASILFLAASVYIPALNPIFKTRFMPVNYLLIALVFSLIPFFAGELSKKYTKTL